MRVDIYPNFISKEEIDALNTWVELGVKNNWLGFAVTQNLPDLTLRWTPNRLTTRMYSDRFEYPQIVRDISHKVRSFLGIDFLPLIERHGKEGVVVSYTMNGGDLYKHKDSRHNEGALATLRCNILTQAPENGGQLYIQGAPVTFNVGDLHCYLASEHEHYVTEIEGDTPRIMWMFGAHVPAEDWNSGKIKVQQ